MYLSPLNRDQLHDEICEALSQDTGLPSSRFEEPVWNVLVNHESVRPTEGQDTGE